MKRILSILLLFFATYTISVGGTMAPENDPDRQRAQEAIDKTNERQEKFARDQLNKPYPSSGLWREENFAFGAYHFNTSLSLAQDGLARVRNTFMNTDPEDGFWESGAHWHVYLIARIYWMYSSKSETPRMIEALDGYLEDILHAYLINSHYVSEDMVDYNHIWTYKGSENHHLQAFVSAWSAAHILKDIDEYQDMKIGELSLKEFATKFDSYFKLYFREKASKGLLTEIASPTYVKYSLNTLYNIYDFTEDEELKELANKFLNLYFADWAIEQYGGFRGGSKHRSYTGRSSLTTDSNVGWFTFGLGGSTNHPGYASAATTTWRPNVLVAELALAQKDRGTFQSLSRRPGIRIPGTTGNEASPEGGKLLRSTYHTENFIIGMSMVPALDRGAWTAICSQNRHNCILFNGTKRSKIFTQRHTPSAGSVYNAEWGVQHKGMMMLQMLPAPYSDKATGQLIFFGKELDREEENGWVFVEADSAYCAVKVVKGNASFRSPTKADYRDGKGDLNAGTYLELDNDLSPIIFEVVKKKDYASFEEFKEEIQNNELTETETSVSYISSAYQDTITLYSDFSQLPEINGKTVNLDPDFVYQSPYINGKFGESIITISRGDKELVLDFNQNSAIGENRVSICPGGEYNGLTEPGSYQDTYITASGNDSTHTTHLSFELIKPGIERDGNTLRPSEEFSTYQWYYTGGIIPGATDRDYVIKWSGQYYVQVTNEAGCTFVSDTLFYQLLTSSDDFASGDPAWSVMPNPCKGKFSLRFDSNPREKISLKLMNSLGQIVEQRELSNPVVNQMEEFDVSRLGRGMYFLFVDDKKRLTSKKIVVL